MSFMWIIQVTLVLSKNVTPVILNKENTISVIKKVLLKTALNETFILLDQFVLNLNND